MLSKERGITQKKEKKIYGEQNVGLSKDALRI